MKAILSAVNQAITKFFQRKWQSFFYAILPHPTEAKVLMLFDESGYFLPYTHKNEDIYYDDFITIKEELEKRLSFRFNILYYASLDYNESKRQNHAIYVLEHHLSIEAIKESSWIDLDTLENLTLKQPEHKLVIQEYLTEVNSGNIPELRPQWARKGWFDSASKWIKEQLLELNYQQTSSVECIRSWGMSCVLRVSTNTGNIYFKEASTLPLFCNEPSVTSELSKLFPEHIPVVLATEPQRHWMLLADFGESVGRKAPIKVQKEVYSLLALIQIQSVQHIDKLLSIGCLDRRLEWLSNQIDVLFNDEVALSQMQPEEIKQLQSLAPSLKEKCIQLASYQVPQTLVHGDLHLNNVAFHNGKYILFDWTDSCISHPFFDMFELFFQRKKKSSSTLTNLRDEYLVQWAPYESKSRLLEAWTLAKPLCALHHAVTYQYIVACLEPRAKQEVSNALPAFLRELLKCMK